MKNEQKGKKYEKPMIVKKTEMRFPLDLLESKGKRVICKQCSSCHSCR